MLNIENKLKELEEIIKKFEVEIVREFETCVFSDKIAVRKLLKLCPDAEIYFPCYNWEEYSQEGFDEYWKMKTFIHLKDLISPDSDDYSWRKSNAVIELRYGERIICLSIFEKNDGTYSWEIYRE